MQWIQAGFKNLAKLLRGMRGASRKRLRSEEVACEDDSIIAQGVGRRFSLGNRPVIRWTKGEGLDDEVTRTAIAQATRLFGSSVDYCLCTNSIDAARVRSILAWAAQPVEWWPVTPADNQALAIALQSAGCAPEIFGYWWKWFPERVRPAAPEWILDGDMVVTSKPKWIEPWLAGVDGCRVSQDDRSPVVEEGGIHGRYGKYVDGNLKFYSGLISLPPNVRFMPQMLEILRVTPLAPGHNGRKDMCEQGVVAATFQRVGATPIPLHEFPFGRAFEDFIDYGLSGDRGDAWGYHFGNAFIRENPHFKEMVRRRTLFSRTDAPSLLEAFCWLGGNGQWGVPGWSLDDGCAALILDEARNFSGRQVLEVGTSRGHITGMLATLGCRVTTIDRHDRGAAENLSGLGIRFVIDEASQFMKRTNDRFDLIIVDLHGNTKSIWKGLAPLLHRCLAAGGKLLLNNATLWKIPEWQEETGVRWFIESLPRSCRVRLHEEPLPGVACIEGYRN